MKEEKIDKEDLNNSKELCCADKNVCSVDCAPKDNSQFKCDCMGCC